MDSIAPTLGSAAKTAGLPPSTSLSTPSTATSSADQQKSQFLQLLVAQLKGQDPLNPLQGNEFVAQLAQFSSLEELIKIRTALGSVQDLLKNSAPTAQPESAAKTIAA